MRKPTKRQLELTAELLKIRHKERMEVIKQRVEGLARGMSFLEKVKLFLKI